MSTSTPLRFLSGGAAQGLVRALQPAFEAKHSCQLAGSFGAVGAMKDKLLGGEPCDLLILTEALVADLTAKGLAVAGTARNLGVVKTGIALKTGAKRVDVKTPQDLQALLSGAGAIFFPDPAKATAGIHFMKVLQALGLVTELATRLRTFPNGAAAMGELAKCPDASAVGCTQVTEILITEGVQLSGLLPAPHELATVYTAAVCAKGAQQALAAALVEALAGEAAAGERRKAGFE
jgi:molybdate transport system substrate-binding protein